MLSRNRPPVQVSQFSMVPRGDVPRSTFHTQHTYKTTFQTGYLIPFHVDECLPGDVHRGRVSIFARLATPLFPIMDNLTLESFFFFVPCRLVWSNWKKFMGEQASPSDSIAYTIPQVVSPLGGYAVNSIFDYFGLPTALNPANSKSHSCLPLRAYCLIYNEWFRDENIGAPFTVSLGDGPDAYTSFALARRMKKHDYFTSVLPWPQKGGTAVSMPLSGQAVIHAINPANTKLTSVFDDFNAAYRLLQTGAASATPILSTAAGASTSALYADLSSATGATINAMRLSIATQQLLERDARGGTRYTELLRSHFGVTPEDARLQRPEYIGGGRSSVHTQAIPVTSSTGITGATAPSGALAAAATVSGSHEFSYYCAEHGYILGMVHVGADLTYQQGIHRMWTRSTRYDFYFPVFAHLGEQVVRNDEIYVDGGVNDVAAFGYQERWAEYRHRPSRITGLFRSTAAGNIDEWHLAQQFTSLPAFNEAFLQDNPPLSRALAAGAAADGQQILLDSLFDISCTRPVPTYSVPGLDRF